MNKREDFISEGLPPVIQKDRKRYVPLHTSMMVLDEETKVVYRVNSFFSDDAPEMGVVLDTVTLEKADRTVLRGEIVKE